MAMEAARTLLGMSSSEAREMLDMPDGRHIADAVSDALGYGLTARDAISRAVLFRLGSTKQMREYDARNFTPTPPEHEPETMKLTEIAKAVDAWMDRRARWLSGGAAQAA